MVLKFETLRYTQGDKQRHFGFRILEFGFWICLEMRISEFRLLYVMLRASEASISFAQGRLRAVLRATNGSMQNEKNRILDFI